MVVENKYFAAKQFMFACIYYHTTPMIHWHDDDKRGFIYFKYVNDGKEEFHTFHSSNKKLLDAIWNSVVLIRYAEKVVDEVANETKIV